jgi:hypothetical protein
MSPTNLSRRTLVTSAATMPALAVPAFALDAVAPNHPDTELLRRGAKLERVERVWFAQRALEQKHSRAYEAAVRCCRSTP